MLLYYCLLLRKLFSYSVVWWGIVPGPTARRLFLTRQHSQTSTHAQSCAARLSTWRLEMFSRWGLSSYSSETLIVNHSEFRFWRVPLPYPTLHSIQWQSKVTFHPHFCIISCIIELVLVRNMHEIFGTERFSVFDLPTNILFNNKPLTYLTSGINIMNQRWPDKSATLHYMCYLKRLSQTKEPLN